MAASRRNTAREACAKVLNEMAKCYLARKKKQRRVSIKRQAARSGACRSTVLALSFVKKFIYVVEFEEEAK